MMNGAIAAECFVAEQERGCGGELGPTKSQKKSIPFLTATQRKRKRMPFFIIVNINVIREYSFSHKRVFFFMMMTSAGKILSGENSKGLTFSGASRWRP